MGREGGDDAGRRYPDPGRSAGDCSASPTATTGRLPFTRHSQNSGTMAWEPAASSFLSPLPASLNIASCYLLGRKVSCSALFWSLTPMPPAKSRQQRNGYYIGLIVGARASS